MTRTSLTILAAAIVLVATGCTSTNRIAGNELAQTGHWFGHLGIAGHLNDIAVQAPSRLTKLSVLGDGNNVMVEDEVTLGKIEIYGDDNTISIPKHLTVRIHQMGEGNRVVRRASEANASNEPAPPHATAKPPLPAGSYGTESTSEPDQLPVDDDPNTAFGNEEEPS